MVQTVRDTSQRVEGTDHATAAAGSAAPRPGESFEAYHPPSIGVICVMITLRLWAVKPVFWGISSRNALNAGCYF